MRTPPNIILLRTILPLLISCSVTTVWSQDAGISFNKPRFIQAVQTNENRISLKDAMDKLKKQYGIKIAYKQGLLDDKSIASSLLENNEGENIEALLKKILAACQLECKRINDKQFSVFGKDTKKPNSKPPSDTNVTSVPVAVLMGNKNEGGTLIPMINNTVYANDIKGKITAKDGTPVTGASVVLKSNSRIGTTTDVNGNFSLTVPDNIKTIVLVVTYVGFEKQEITIQNIKSEVAVVLQEADQSLSEVVVTALGIKKERKALAYSVTEVKGSEFTQAREINIGNALVGKIAGVNATSLASGPGGSSRVVIRGNGGQVRNGQPLYVINGLPMDNSSIGTPITTNHNGLNVDRGDGIAGINPDDIETITVLKGGTAAALYGSQASNGVIIITTKKGRAQKGIGIEYNTTLTFETPIVLPDWQYEYGAGRGGVVPANKAEAINFGRLSWGAKMDASKSVIQYDGVSRPYVPQKNNAKNFYNTGTTYTNSLAFMGGSELVNFRLSLSNMDNKSIVPNTSLNKKIVNLSVTGNLSKKLTVEGIAQYNLEKSRNRTTVSDAPGNPNWGLLSIANTVDITTMNPGYDILTGKETDWNNSGFATNPYFAVNRFRNDDNKTRFIGMVSIAYKLLDNLAIKGRIGEDYNNFRYAGVVPTGTAYLPLGGYVGRKENFYERNAELTLNYNTKFLNNFSLNALVGGNRQRNKFEGASVDGNAFVIPFFYHESNLTTVDARYETLQSGINSLFASADIDYKGFLFLTLTGRNDWFSTLSKDNNNIFYPSVGASFIFSEAFNMPGWLNYGKLRASWAGVGGGANRPYLLNLTYSMVQGGHNGQPLQRVTESVVPNPTLQPSKSITYEAGFEMKLFKNRLGVDFAWYDRRSTNLIVETTISNASGFPRANVNVGEVSNKGIELLLTGSLVRGTGLNWDVSYNMAYNKNRVLQLAPNVPSLKRDVSVNEYAAIYDEVGRPMSIIKGYRPKKDEKGNTMYLPNGFEMQGPLVELGQGEHPLTLGLTNTFSYKNFSFNFLIDGKFGGDIYSGTNLYGTRFGLTKITLPGRDNGIVVTGVDANKAPLTVNIPASNVWAYYDNWKSLSGFFVYDASFVKLRQVMLSYNIPVTNFKLLKIQSASISLVARNLLILYKEVPNIDPESTFTNTGSQGIEQFGVPRTRSYGINLMLKL